MKVKIREARERAGFSQKELAEKLKIKPSTFNGYETGAHDPKSVILAQIATTCNTSVDFLLGLSDVAQKESDTLSPEDKVLLESFCQLNNEGRKKVIEYADDLVQSCKYVILKASADKVG